MALIALIALVGAYLIASRLTKTSAELSADRDQRTQAALQEAKAALIAFAADRYKIQGAGLKKLGALPCPDLKLPSAATAGSEESNCTTVLTAIGRLPWKTLNVSSNLSDGSGEPLWYVLSTNFSKLATVINSDTQGQITVTGSAPASTVVALIIAPGLSLLGQNRDKTDLAALNNPSNYLEGVNAGPNDNSFETRVPPNDRNSVTGDLIFNDRVLAITQAELFAAVEPVVINKIRDADVNQPCCNVKAAIEVYRATWGGYPFPAAFSDPCTATASDCKGFVGLTEGWLPLSTDSTSFVNWKTSSPAPTVAAAPGNPGTVDVSPGYADCGNSTSTQLECKFNWCGTTPNLAKARITATANKAGLAFVRSFIDADLTVDRSSSGLNSGWTSSSATIKTSSAYTLQSNGNGTVSLDLEMPSRACTSIRTARIRIPQLPFHSITSASDPVSGWFIEQEWHKLTYYAVSPAWLPGGSANCATSPPCLTVNGLPSNEYPTINDKNAILILTGRSLNGSARPSATLSNYLEPLNDTTSDYIFTHRVGAPGATNDRVVVLSP